jgi:hypothetical protein
MFAIVEPLFILLIRKRTQVQTQRNNYEQTRRCYNILLIIYFEYFKKIKNQNKRINGQTKLHVIV